MIAILLGIRNPELKLHTLKWGACNETILTWTIWEHRNRIIFSNYSFNGSKLLEDAVFLVWSWLRARETDFVMHYNQWSSNLNVGFGK